MKSVCSRALADFNRSYKEAENIYAKYAALHGISSTALCVLYSLYTSESPCTQTQLVEDWGIPMQTINSCLKSLEKNGIVRLQFAEGNRKSKHVCLTVQGEETSNWIVAPLIHAENMAFGALTQEEQQQLLEITKKHNGLLQQLLLNQK